MTDIEQIAIQEQQLQFDTFTASTAWEIGTRLKKAVEAQGLAVAIDIELAGQPLFFFAMPGTTPDNLDWVRRKRNVVRRYHRSSYAIGLELAQRQTTLTDRVGVSAADYATHGGSFPLLIRGMGCMGTITISGLPQRDDHSVIVQVLAEFLGQNAAELALPTPLVN
jgi:uncharacterized protein (UPF0303 family)